MHDTRQLADLRVLALTRALDAAAEEAAFQTARASSGAGASAWTTARQGARGPSADDDGGPRGDGDSDDVAELRAAVRASAAAHDAVVAPYVAALRSHGLRDEDLGFRPLTGAEIAEKATRGALKATST